jgi:putative aldouronate transport system permease protein
MITGTQQKTAQISNRRSWSSLAGAMRRDWMLYLMFLPGLIYIIIFRYVPMYGVTIAFKDYKLGMDILNAPWVGWQHFVDLFGRTAFRRALYNNILISIYKLIFGFPFPIILSLLINEVRQTKLKKFVQTSVILPNFVSWVVVYGLFYAILSPHTGVLQNISSLFGYEGTIPDLLSSQSAARPMIVLSHIWKGSGMGTIVYLAAITGIDQGLYEAAAIDGAGRWRQMWNVTLPCIRTTIVVLLIFRVGEMMYAGFDQIFVFSNDAIISKIDIIDTYVYRLGLQDRKYGLSTAAGLFQSFIGLVLVLVTNWAAKKIDPESGIM